MVVLGLERGAGAVGRPLRPRPPEPHREARPAGQAILLGADEFGRDILSRVIYGSRVALLVGLLSAAIAVLGGLVLGTVAGFAGGWLDAVMMRGLEILLAFPYLLLALAIVAALGPGALNTTIAVGIWGVPAVDAHRAGLGAGAARDGVRRGRPRARRPGAGAAAPPHPAATSSPA